MAFKTLIRQLISKFGVMSIEMETAYRNDMAAIEDNGVAYVDNVTDLKEQVATEANKQPIPTVKADANGVVEEKKPTTDKDNIDLGF